MCQGAIHWGLQHSGSFITPTRFVNLTNPITYLVNLEKYTVAPNTEFPNESLINWVGEKVRYILEGFTLRLVLCEQRNQLRKDLEQGLLLLPVSASMLEMLDLGQIFDDRSSKQAGYSFVRDKRNHFPLDGSKWLQSHILMNSKLKERFCSYKDCSRPGDYFKPI